jgi:plastocyanin
MSRHLLVALLCCALVVLLAGCGSSNGTGSNASPTSGVATDSTATTTGRTTGAPSESIKVDTTPKFASPSPSAPVESGVVQIAYRNIAIDPDTVRVKVGSTIKWTNYDSTQANVTSEGGPQKFASKNFGEGGTFELKATKPGVIHYECTLYPVTMNGTIEVVS